MKTIVAGSRNIENPSLELALALYTCPFHNQITEIVSGHAKGIDQAGEKLAYLASLPCKVFPADWNKYGKRAGYLRNEEMAKYADALIAVWDGESKGTKHMIDLANRYKLKIHVYTVENKNEL
jgi:glycerophosphoryl diester phosphodiesterase